MKYEVCAVVDGEVLESLEIEAEDDMEAAYVSSDAVIEILLNDVLIGGDRENPWNRGSIQLRDMDGNVLQKTPQPYGSFENVDLL